jgi:hypothetical protein
MMKKDDEKAKTGTSRQSVKIAPPTPKKKSGWNA